MHQCQFLSFDKFTIVLLLNRFLGLLQPVKFITSQTRNPGKILLGAPIAADGSENKQQVPLFTHCLRKMGKPVPGMRVEVCPWVGPEERLRYFAHPLGGIVCRGHVQHTAFTPGSSEVQLLLLLLFWQGEVLFVSFVLNLP